MPAAGPTACTSENLASTVGGQRLGKPTSRPLRSGDVQHANSRRQRLGKRPRRFDRFDSGRGHVRILPRGTELTGIRLARGAAYCTGRLGLESSRPLPAGLAGFSPEPIAGRRSHVDPHTAKRTSRLYYQP